MASHFSATQWCSWLHERNSRARALRIESTLVYIQIESALFQNMTENWTCWVAETLDQAKQLIEAGFGYVMQKDNLAYFRKRK